MPFSQDVNKEPGAEEKFKQISNAYEVTADPRGRMDCPLPSTVRPLQADDVWV